MPSPDKKTLGDRQRGAGEAPVRPWETAANIRDAGAAPAAATAANRLAQVREALHADRFRLVYQPIASLSGQPSSLYEVFIRMVAEDGRDILPAEFIRTVEAAGLTERLDRWVLSRAVHVLESQRSRRDKPTLFVKLSPESIGKALLRWLSDIVRTARLEPAQLVLQLRQQHTIAQPAKTRRFLEAARSHGYGVALEHFTAADEKELQLLQSLRPDFVRLAPHITEDIGTNRQHQQQAEIIAAHCRAVGAKTIAGLVQDALHLSVLWRCGIEYIQGYFMQEPVDVFAGDETLPHDKA